MKILQAFFLHLTFLGLFEGYLCSNPESVIAQSPEDNEDRAREIQKRENQEGISASSGRPRGLVVRVMRPAVVGSRLIWREVARERLESIRDFTRFQNTWKDSQINESYSRRTTEKSIIDVSTEIIVDDDKPQMPQDNFQENNAKIVNDKLRMPQNNGRWNTRIIGNNRSQMPPNNVRGSSATNGNDNGSQMPETNFRGNSGTNGDANRPQIRQSNIKGNNNFNENPKTSVDTSPTTIESEEAYFEDDDQESIGTKSPKRISPDSNFFAGIVNDFAFKLVESLNIESNFVISPLSIYIALSMCYLGSEGRTKAQMEQALGMNDNAIHGEHLHQGIKELLSLVMEETSGYQLFVANGMFLGKNFTTNPQFEEDIKNYYDAELRNVDFGNPQLSLQFINEWVSESTRNMITKMINSPPPLLTRLILLNAIFFKGIWKTQFPVHLTYSGKFHLLNGNDKEIRFMNLFDETFPIARSEEHKHSFIKLPYEGDQASMIIALPFSARDKPMPTIRDQILCYMRDAMENRKLDTVAIPKFRLEYRNSLRRPLQELGVTDIFNRNTVDLKKLRKENDVYVSAIMHKAAVEVDEVGTTASAATDVRFVPLSYRNITNFVADHPFAFYIVHEPTGLVLFYGKVFDFDSAPVVPNDRSENSGMRVNRFNSDRRG